MVMDRTKSEIESENESLWRAIGKMRDQMDKLQVQNRILRGQLQAAQDDLSIEEHQVQIIAGKGQKGSKTNQEMAAERTAFLRDEYKFYLGLDLDSQTAREKANNELADKFGEKYRLGERRLRDLLKD